MLPLALIEHRKQLLIFTKIAWFVSLQLALKPQHKKKSAGHEIHKLNFYESLQSVMLRPAPDAKLLTIVLWNKTYANSILILFNSFIQTHHLELKKLREVFISSDFLVTLLIVTVVKCKMSHTARLVRPCHANYTQQTTQKHCVMSGPLRVRTRDRKKSGIIDLYHGKPLSCQHRSHSCYQESCSA